MGDLRNGSANGDGFNADSTASISEPIAIVGMSLRLPGGIHTEEAFWNLLMNKATTRGPIPLSRYNSDGFYTKSGRPGSINVRHGHFLAEEDGIDLLDTSFFNISKAEVEKLDPQQRLLLEVVWECVESAGQTDWRGSNTGVFVGAWGYDWVDFLSKDPQQVGGILNVTGSHDYAIANRISYEYDLHGPSMTIKTACSSSMISLHQAVQALRSGECDAAIVAGTNAIVTPTQTIEQTEAGVLSPTGECRTFDATANGYGRGEAINALLLKKLSLARNANDTIRAVIRGTAVNSDGRSAGLTTPNPKAHVRLIRQAYRAAGLLDPSETPYVEVHGTGTKTGDPLELEAIAHVFGDVKDTYVGGVKANVGHSESASGITSIIKAVLALEKGVIPPQANFSTPNPKIPFETARLIVPLQPTPWPEGRPKRVSINSFGITGANAHAVIESAATGVHAADVNDNELDDQDKSELLLLSAANPQSLNERCAQMQLYAGQYPERLAQLAYTLACRRDHLAYRAYGVANRLKPVEFSIGEKVRQSPSLTFVFTGQGAQWPSMGKELIERFQTYREDIVTLAESLGKLPHPPSWNLLYELLKEDVKSNVHKAEFSQPLCTAIQIALVNLLRRLNITPSAVVGHSSGEIGAAYAAGALSSEEAIAIAYYRGLTTTMSTRRGAMAAVGLSQAEARLYLENGVVIACDNSPQSVTLSGDDKGIDRTIKQIKLDDPNIFARRLKTDGMAYHSHHMTEIGPQYEQFLQPCIKPKSPATRFFSTVTGDIMEESTMGPKYWRQNLESPVQFYSAIRNIIEKGKSDQLFLEIGPHSAFAGPLRQIFKTSSSKSRLGYVSSLVRGKNAIECIQDMCDQLYLHGIPLSFAPLMRFSRSLTDLPLYPWRHNASHWAETRAVRDWRLRQFPPHELLGSRVLEGNDLDPVWRNMLHLKDTHWLTGHKVYNDVIFPCAGYIAIAGEAIRQISAAEGFHIRHLRVKTAMVLHDDPVEVMTCLRRKKEPGDPGMAWYEFTIISHNGSMWAEHCTGEVRAAEPGFSMSTRLKTNHELPRKVKSPYSSFQSIGLHYDGAFRGLDEVSIRPGQRMAVASLKAQAETDSTYALHPSTIDHCLQLLGMAACEGLSRRLERIPLPTFVKEISIHPAHGQHRLQAGAVANQVSNQGDIGGEMIITEGSTVVLDIKECKLSAFEDSSTTILDDPIAAARLSWRPHLDFVPLETLMLSHDKDPKDIRNMEEYSLLCTAEILERIKDTQDCAYHFTKFRKWMTEHVSVGMLGQNNLVTNSKELLELDPQKRMERILELRTELKGSTFVHVAELTTRLLDNCVGIFDGSTEVLEVYLKDDALTKLYGFTGDRIDASEFFLSAGHTNPTLRVLEIGAGTGGTTLIALNALTSINNEPMYSRYTFTDISSGFFSAARDRFVKFPGLEFRMLDISKDPADQGFELGSYDLIIASNVIHATERLTVTLKNVRRLLSPYGRFFLQELTPGAAKMVNLIMGPLSGWWLGEADGRVDEPIVAVERWAAELQAAGFAGLECVVRDDPRHEISIGANMVSKPAVNAPEYKSVTILIRPDQADNEMLQVFSRTLAEQGYFIDVCILGTALPPYQDIISLVEIDRPFFDQVTATDLASFQNCISEMTSSRMLWVMGPAQLKPSNAHFGLTLGVVRCIRAELSTQVATLEVDRYDRTVSKTIFKVFESFSNTTSISATNPELEYIMVDGVVRVGRFHWTNVSKELEESQDITRLPIKLETTTSDTKSSAGTAMKWLIQPRIKLESDEVAVRPKYIGLSSMDFPNFEDGAAHDYCGEIIEVAEEAAADGPRVGDMVMSIGSHGICTIFKTKSRNVGKVPEDLDLVDAASVSLAYAIALYSLRGVAKLQTVLITSAVSDIGLASITVCRQNDVEPYCSVRSQEQADFLVDQVCISRDAIAIHHHTTILNNLAQRNGKMGFDIVLNVVSEDLEESSKCVASRGKLINVGRRPPTTAFDIAQFATNRMFFGVDMAQVEELYPELLQEIVARYQYNQIWPLEATQVLEAENLHAELAPLLKDPATIGKLLVKLPTDPSSLPREPTPPTLEFRSDTTYIIAGGLGGLGRALSTCMVEHGARHITYLSRSAGTNPEHEAFFRELEAQGCTAHAIPCDISCLNSVRAAIEQIDCSLPVAGVLQMAMTLQDRPFLNMSHDDWIAAIKPKVDGTWNLHSATETVPLDFFVMLGSISGTFGIPGQANYAAGNSFQDAFVQYRQSLGLPASVLNIGAMADVGYVSQNRDVQEYFQAAGMPFMTESQLFDALHLSILQQYSAAAAAPTSKEARGGADPGFTSRSQLTLGLRATKPMTDPSNRVLWKRDRKADIYRNIQAAALSKNSRMTTAEDKREKEKLAAFMASIRTAADTDRESILHSPDTLKLLSREIGAFIHESMLKSVDDLDEENDDDHTLGLDRSLVALGVDSLVTVEVRTWLRRKFEVEVSTLEMLNGGTVKNLAELVLERLRQRFGILAQDRS
ncbi:Highly reducing polyketide synthase gloL [Exophiala dermatitidis]